jgi:hypothetical protein
MMVSNQEESFLITLLYLLPLFRKRSVGFFERQEGIAELIDFPLANDDEETSNHRKRSFSLYDEEED